MNFDIFDFTYQLTLASCFFYYFKSLFSELKLIFKDKNNNLRNFPYEGTEKNKNIGHMKNIRPFKTLLFNF